MDINLPKCDGIDYINFLIAASNVFSCTEAAIVESTAKCRIKSIAIIRKSVNP